MCRTLSPMGSFTSELGVQFEACMEAPHVINADSQVRMLLVVCCIMS
jgi:Fanconi anemia group J protein